MDFDQFYTKLNHDPQWHRGSFTNADDIGYLLTSFSSISGNEKLGTAQYGENVYIRTPIGSKGHLLSYVMAFTSDLKPTIVFNS